MMEKDATRGPSEKSRSNKEVLSVYPEFVRYENKDIVACNICLVCFFSDCLKNLYIFFFKCKLSYVFQTVWYPGYHGYQQF